MLRALHFSPRALQTEPDPCFRQAGCHLLEADSRSSQELGLRSYVLLLQINFWSGRRRGQTGESW